MPSISDNLIIASRAIENALTTQSAQKVSAKSQTSTQRRKDHPAHQRTQETAAETMDEDVCDEVDKVVSKHIDIRV